MGAGFAIRARANKTAEILIYEDVGAGWFGGVSAKQFADDLKELGDVTQIDVRINSYGGDVFDGLAMYNQLVQHKARITTHVDGVAASIASVIAMAGDEIHIAESGWLMIHDAWGMAIGNAADLRRQADLMDSVSEQLAGVYVARSGQPAEQVRAWMAEETWFNAGEAIDNKFATAMSENLRVAAHAAFDRSRFRNAPAALSAAPAKAMPVIKLSAEELALRDQVAGQRAHLTRARVVAELKSRGAG